MDKEILKKGLKEWEYEISPEVEDKFFKYSNFWEPKKESFLEKIWDVITTPYYRVKWKIKEVSWLRIVQFFKFLPSDAHCRICYTVCCHLPRY